MDTNMLLQMIGAREVEKYLLRLQKQELEARVTQLVEHERQLMEQNAAMAAQIGADNGEPA